MSLKVVILHQTTNTAGKWCISRSGMIHLAPCENITCRSLGYEISFEGCLCALVWSRRVVLHKLISASANGEKSGATVSLWLGTQSVVWSCVFHYNLHRLPCQKAYLFKIQIIRWDAKISILKYSCRGSELALHTSEDTIQVLYQHRPAFLNLSWALRRRPQISEPSPLHTCQVC